MKQLWYILAATTFLAIACKKESGTNNCDISINAAPAHEVESLEQYLEAKGITAERHEKGFYYIIDKPGTGAQPTACSDVRVNYIGRLTNGDIFDQSNNISFNLFSLIQGWQAGIPLIQQGGRIVLYLPPALGYGEKTSGSIPSNSITIFTVDLLEVK
jgi:FKBP-type peptidyl-prolyl cis-trans isomerase FkpA